MWGKRFSYICFLALILFGLLFYHHYVMMIWVVILAGGAAGAGSVFYINKTDGG